MFSHFKITVLFCALFASLGAVPASAQAARASMTRAAVQDCDSRTPISHLPYSINKPGSYVLTKNLKGDLGIHITTSNVTLDLNGFTLTGVNPTAAGVYVVGSGDKNVVIKNGTVQNWFHGILSSAGQCHVENIRALNNNSRGIWLSGPGNIIRNCQANGNAREGILAQEALIEGNICMENQDNGIEAQTGCLVLKNISNGNQVNGIELYEGSIAMDNICNNNGLNGIYTFSGTSGNKLSSNLCTGNTTAGISLNGLQDYVSENLANDNNTWGIAVIRADTGSVIKENMASGNFLVGFQGQDPGATYILNIATGQQFNFLVVPGNDAGPVGDAANSISPFTNIVD